MTTYDIRISFAEGTPTRNEILYNGNAEYINNNSDRIVITNSEITISANRANRSNPEDILSNTNGTLFKQINKGLIYYCALTGNNRNISGIEIFINKGIHGEANHVYNTTELKNPLDQPISTNLYFDRNALDIIFNESEKSRILLNSLSYWLKAMSATDEGNRFEKLWRSFNAIYSGIALGITLDTQEKKKLIKVRKFIAPQESCFPKSIEYFRNYTSADLRSLRLKEWVYSDFPENKIPDLKGMVLRYNDSRINEVFEMLLAYRQKNMKQEILDVITDHIRQRKEANEHNNMELLLFHIFNYMYFLRNKYFHAEKFDTTFSILANNEHAELKKMNEILSLFLVELINANSFFPFPVYEHFFDLLAPLLGMEKRDLKSEWNLGKSIMDIAEEKGMSKEDIIENLPSQHKDSITNILQQKA